MVAMWRTHSGSGNRLFTTCSAHFGSGECVCNVDNFSRKQHCAKAFLPKRIYSGSGKYVLPYGQRIQEVAKDCLQNEEVILDRRKVLDCGGFIREVAQPYVPNGNFFPKAAGACLPYGEETLEAAQVLHMGNLARKLQGLVCQKAKASRKRKKLACHKEKTSRPQHTLVCHMLNVIRKCQIFICQKRTDPGSDESLFAIW